MDKLTELERVRQGRAAEPTAGCADSQSVKTAMQPVEEVGFDGNKKIKGRKRHILTDTQGLILCIVVTAASTGNRQGLKQLLNRWFIKGVHRLRKLWVDVGYAGEALRDWVVGLKRTHKIDLQVTDHDGQGFQVVPNSEAMIQIAMISLLIRRLA